MNIYFVKHVIRERGRERVGKASKKTLFPNATPSPLVSTPAVRTAPPFGRVNPICRYVTACFISSPRPRGHHSRSFRQIVPSVVSMGFPTKAKVLGCTRWGEICEAFAFSSFSFFPSLFLTLLVFVLQTFISLVVMEWGQQAGKAG